MLPVRVSRHRTVLRMRADPNPAFSGGSFRGRVAAALARTAHRAPLVTLRKGQVRNIAIRTSRRPAPGTTLSVWMASDPRRQRLIKLRRRR